jgi:hypothetical protein
MIRRWLRGVAAGRCGSRALFYAAAVAAAGLVLGCGSTSTETTSAASTDSVASTSTAATTAQPARVALHLDEGSYSLSSPAATVAGTAARGASVTVNGHAVAVHSGRWRDTLRLHIGSNPIEVEATMSDRAPSTAAIQVTRHHSAAELEASARARELRAEAHKRHETEAKERKQREEQEKQAEHHSQQLAECTNGTYVNAAGNTVCKPVESSTQPAGATAECEDGTYSFSESRSGTCSHHGGVRTWLNG